MRTHVGDRSESEERLPAADLRRPPRPRNANALASRGYGQAIRKSGAGVTTPSRALLNEVHEAVALNVLGPIVAMLAVIPDMRARGKGRMIDDITIEDAHDLAAGVRRGSRRTVKWASIDRAGPGHSAGEGARDDFGYRGHSAVCVFPARHESPANDLSGNRYPA